MADDTEPTYQPDTPLVSIDQSGGVKASFANPKDAAQAELDKYKLACARRGIMQKSTTCGGPIQ